MGSILKSKKRQDVDAIVHGRQGEKHLQVQRKQVADTSAVKRASATANIKAVQIQQLSKEHLQRRINREYRYIRYQKSKSLIVLPISTMIHSKVLLFYALDLR